MSRDGYTNTRPCGTHVIGWRVAVSGSGSDGNECEYCGPRLNEERTEAERRTSKRATASGCMKGAC